MSLKSSDAVRLSRVAIDARLVGGTFTGDSTYWLGLLQGLASRADDAEILLVGNADRPEGLPWRPGFSWLKVDGRNPRWWSLVRFPLAVRRWGAQVAHVQYTVSPLLGRSVATTIHDISFALHPEWFRFSDRAILNLMVPLAIRRASRMLTVSQTSAREIETRYPRAKGRVRVTPLALNPKIRPVEPTEAESRVRAKFGIGGPYILTVGTSWPRKNMALAVAACEALPPTVPHRLVVVGKSGWGAELEGSRVLRTGYVDDDDLAALYSAADLYLSPSRHEGFGLTLLEAFACGAPVICGPGGALPETAGGAALVIPDYEVGTWSEAIEGLLGNSSKLREMRERGRRRVLDFSWESMAERTFAAYEEVWHETRFR
ncbi:MAG: glycosyltransferase family 1 protein [Fimbriimonadaceae bacterium]